MSSSKSVFLVGANHRSANIDIREHLYLSSDQIKESLPKLIEGSICSEAVILSTCNRLEIVAVTDEPLDQNAALRIFQVLHEENHGLRTGVNFETIEKSCYFYTATEAIEHVFQVASGIASLVLGETQITGQFKQQSELARKAGTVGSLLDRLCQQALSTSAKVRSHTDIGKSTVSLSHAAIDLANKVYGNIPDHKIAIVGAGEMSRLAAIYAKQYQPQEFFIINRTVEKASELVQELGRGQAYGLEDLSLALQMSDIVISSTSKDGFIVDVETIAKVQMQRKYRPWFFIDIALPRDIPPECAEIENVYLFDIDDLKQIVAENIEERRLAAEKAKGLIVDSAISFTRWMENLEFKPALSGFRSYLEDLFGREQEKTLSKSIFRDLSDSQKTGIKKLMDSLVGKMLADAGNNVLTPPEGFYKEQLAASLAALFPRPSDNSNQGTPIQKEDCDKK